LDRDTHRGGGRVKHYREQAIPARIERVVERVTCDMCGATIPRPHGFEISDIKVSYRNGTHYPEGGSGTEERVDLCLVCFTTRLIPWLRSQGCTPSVEDWSWGW
jgi:hypothetical protein